MLYYGYIEELSGNDFITKRGSNMEKSVAIPENILGTSAKRVRGEEIRSHYGQSEYADEKSFVVTEHAQDTDYENIEVDYPQVPPYQANNHHAQRGHYGMSNVKICLSCFIYLETNNKKLTTVLEADKYDEASQAKSKLSKFDQMEDIDQSQIITNIDAYLKCAISLESSTLDALSKLYHKY